ncbi:Shedu immune nuclease family protein [Streptosporangium sp. NPDC000563]|uniref:Shedu immune nuclease family protein n=1 Tax=Streptosporangium sp. NPDC000563 TaxID=3154366 RepID=UPI00331CDA92
MTLDKITRDDVLRSIDEYKLIGQKSFLDKYGYGPSVRYLIAYQGTAYDAKAILGVAHKFSQGKALRPENFSGGQSHTIQTLRNLGFEVQDSLSRVSRISSRLLFKQFGGQCAFSGCSTSYLRDGTPLLEIARISSTNPASPRHEPGVIPNAPENLIVLCPTHHSLIDRDPSRFTVRWLKNLRSQRIAQFEIRYETPSTATNTRTTVDLPECIQVWEQEKGNSDEEFWQSYFQDRPETLALALEGRAYCLKSKCYVGGKTVENKQGNEIDFLAQHRSNAALLEIKPPTTDLMASKYRGNAILPARDLIGACMQILEYKNSLAFNMHALSFASSDLQAFDPRALVIIGNLEAEEMNDIQLRSFELFRNSLNGIRIITFDELFNGLRQWLDLTGNNG